MLTRIALVVVLLTACGGSGKTSEAGPVETVTDLRSRITNAEVAKRAPTDDKATKQEFSVEAHGVKAKAVWRTFEDGGAKYIVSAGWEVVTPVKGVTLENLGAMNPVNAGTEAAPIQEEILRLRWHDNSSSSTQFGDLSVKIDASGKASLN